MDTVAFTEIQFREDIPHAGEPKRSLLQRDGPLHLIPNETAVSQKYTGFPAIYGSLHSSIRLASGIMAVNRGRIMRFPLRSQKRCATHTVMANQTGGEMDGRVVSRVAVR